MERRRVQAMEERYMRSQTDEAAAAEDAVAGIVRTTAMPRPNACIPNDDLGIPKPYGGHAPFKPVEAGSTMRHIRKPVVKEIEL